MATRLCACGCGDKVPSTLRSDAKYASQKCANRAARRRNRARKRLTDRPRRVDGRPLGDKVVEFKDRADSLDGRGSARRGPLYDRIVHQGYAEALMDGSLSDQEVADQLDCARSSVTRVKIALLEDRANGVVLADWERSAEALEALTDFGYFCRRYWPDEPLEPFHEQWADALAANAAKSGRLMLLAPQRHAKTTTLWKYCIWKVCQDPDRRILWVGKTQKLAEDSIGRIRQEFDHNRLLVDEMFGPGVDLAPAVRTGLSWTNAKMTISQRTRVQSAPTLAALGVGGSILGRDADDIVIDDPMDRASALSATERAAVVEWFFTDFTSRKMPRTSVAYIGSRQHLEDLPGHILRDHAGNWDVLVYRAHDPACTIPDDQVDRHVDCVLWPSERPWSWLFEQKEANRDHFTRNYQNNPKSDNTVLVTAADLERCKDLGRDVGEIPAGTQHIIAGIDPATAKATAGVLFAWDGERRHLIDYLETEPGVRGISTIIRKWVDAYACHRFVLESNMGKWAWDDRDVRELLSETGADLIPHGTYHNKTHHSGGVLAMFAKMRTDPPAITFPYKGPDSRRKMERLFRSLLLYDPDGNKHADDDLPMAMWFCQPFMDRWSTQFVARAEVAYPQTFFPGQTAYPSQTTGRRRRLEVVKEPVVA